MPRLATALYDRLPMPARQAAVAWAGLRNSRLRYGNTYRQTLQLLEASEYWNVQRMRELQQRQLLHLLQEAKTGTTYYADHLAGLSPQDLADAAASLALNELPLLEKTTLKANTAAFRNSNRRTTAVSSTSGSTGSPLFTEIDAESMQISFAFMHRHRMWATLPALARSVRLSGRLLMPSSRSKPPFWLLNPAERQLLVSTYHLRDDLLPSIVARIRQFRPQVIDGYPTAIRLVAEHCRRTNTSLPSLQAAITTAETLTPDMRAAITEGLQVKLLDYYSASEGVPFVQECEHGSYHVRPESGIIEILNPDGTAANPGEIGEIVATSFRQWKVPLIRYRTGDMAEVASHQDKRCKCGRTLPFLARIHGRLEDLVFARDGRWIGMFSYRTLKHVTGVREAQIVQTAPDRFRLRLSLDGAAPRSSVEQQAHRVFSDVLGYAAHVSFEYVASIPRGANGKFRAVIRDFQPPGETYTT